MGVEVPRTVGGYTLVDRLGVGGTASVYLGRKRLHDGFEWVALKCLHPHLASFEHVESMFLTEAELLSRLHHPNICDILRYGTEDGIPFIATRYLKGGSLDQLQRKMMGRLIPIELMSWIVAEACAGLHHAHEARDETGAHLGIVHRDVSPQNIFVTFDGKVQLLDFGVAHAAIATSKSQANEVRGKDGYMSPEQVAGGALDRRSDIFSTGIVLWEALTGRRLFARDNALATALAITEQPAPDPKSVNPRIPDALSEIVLKALSIDIEDRFATALEMELALRRAITDDLSPPIQLQVLTRELFGKKGGDPEADLELERRRLEWLDSNEDDDLLEMTEVASPSSRPAIVPAAMLPAAVLPDADDTLSPQSEPETLPPPLLEKPVAVKTRRSSRMGLLLVVLAMVGVLAVYVLTPR